MKSEKFLEIIDNGRAVGKLHIRPDGIMTLFEARLDSSAGLCRLWLIGEDGSGYLGVPVPEGDALVFRKKYSRRDMAAFPSSPLFAATRDMRPPDAEKVDRAAETAVEVKASPAESSRDEIQWTPSTLGTYTALHNGVMLTAIPAKLRHRPDGVRTETVDGKICLVFRRRY